jgi:hypothetical protein
MADREGVPLLPARPDPTFVEYMPMRPFALFFLTLGLFATISSADVATSPELSTPKLAALSFVRAMELNSMQAFETVTIGGKDEYALFEPLLKMVGAAKDLEKAAREKFGKAGRAIVRNSPAVGLEVQVQESDVSVTGDTAVVRRKGDEDPDPLTLRKTPVGWKVDLTAIQNRKAMTAAAPNMKKLERVFIDSAADIRAGKFKSADEAEKVILKRMQDAAASKAK